MTVANNDEMTPLQRARDEWEANTTPHPKIHRIISEYRAEDRIVITKFETLQPGGSGATRLIEFLKTLADKYQIPLWGHARKYDPDPPTPKGHLLTKDELDIFYKKRGFELCPIDANTSDMWYIPKIPVK
jgi:hypothetical protein